RQRGMEDAIRAFRWHRVLRRRVREGRALGELIGVRLSRRSHTVRDDGSVIDAYLARLGVEREEPAAAALQRLHHAQLERGPYETVGIHIGEQRDCSATKSFERIASTSWGGYCFHLNGAFSELLIALGYQVTRHVGGVHGPDGPSHEAMTNHLVLTVS